MNFLPGNYQQIISGLREKIKRARLKAIFSANKELLYMYWEIGSVILQQQKKAGWGAKVIDRLSSDLRAEFPDFKGLSVRNLKYMRAFAKAWPEFANTPALLRQIEDSSAIEQQPAAQLQVAGSQNSIIVQQAAAQLPWGHHQVLLDKVKDTGQRIFYIQRCVENGWSRDMLIHQVESHLYERTGMAITNFKQTLPSLQSDLVQQTLKNPYVFDFLSLREDLKEKELEKALIQHLKKFMLELGKGFAYVGNQKNVAVGNADFFLDLLFYNYNLHCFVVVELKMGAFEPEFAGKLNFYVNVINDQLKGREDKPTIGILLCKTPDKTVVRYSLQGITSPIGVAEYELSQDLPEKLEEDIPGVEELEAELEKEYKELNTHFDENMISKRENISN